MNPRTVQTQYVEDFFVYTINFLNLGAGSTQSSNLQIEADSDFKLVKLAQFSDIGYDQDRSSYVIPLVTIQITDTGSGRQLFNTPTPIPSLFGSGEIPFILPVARIFKARSSVAIQVNNFSTSSAYNLRLSLIGTKIFKLS